MTQSVTPSPAQIDAVATAISIEWWTQNFHALPIPFDELPVTRQAEWRDLARTGVVALHATLPTASAAVTALLKDRDLALELSTGLATADSQWTFEREESQHDRVYTDPGDKDEFVAKVFVNVIGELLSGTAIVPEVRKIGDAMVTRALVAYGYSASEADFDTGVRMRAALTTAFTSPQHPTIIQVRAQALEEAARSGLFGTSAQSTLLRLAEREGAPAEAASRSTPNTSPR